MDYIYYGIAGMTGFMAGYIVNDVMGVNNIKDTHVVPRTPNKLFVDNGYVIIINHPIYNRRKGLINLLIGSSKISTNIDNELAIKLCKELSKLDKLRSIHIILNTTGGNLSAIEMICKALLQHHGKITVDIPNYCFSGGTYIALLADEIYLGKNSFIGPTDPQLNLSLLGTYPASSVIEAIQDTSENNILTRFAFNVAQKAMNRCNLLTESVMARNYDNDTIENIKKMFNSGIFQHDQTFSFNELIDLGLNIKGYIPDKINKYIDR